MRTNLKEQIVFTVFGVEVNLLSTLYSHLLALHSSALAERRRAGQCMIKMIKKIRVMLSAS